MKHRILFVLLCWISCFSTYGQGHNPNLNPEDTICFVKLKLIKPDGTAYANAPVVLKGKKGHLVKATTENDGRAKVRVPFDDTYTVHCGEHTCMRPITVNSFPYVTYNYQAYTHRFIYFTFTYRNFTNERLAGEEVVLHSSTGETYKGVTNAEGQVVFYLPFGPKFRIAVKYHDNVKTIHPQDVGKEYKIMSTIFTWMGAKEKERRAHVADSLAKVIHRMATYELDSLVRSGNQDKIAEEDIYIPINYDSVAWVETMLKIKAQTYKSKLKEDPNYFEVKNKAVLAPLYRLHKKFGKKIIVTDITGSMYGYIEQVMLWHALNFMEEVDKKYLFFNDGDQKSTNQKIIGSTGGLYFCEGQIKDFKTILNTMRKGMRNGGGGEYPENDVEALLAAQSRKEKVEEIFLIADNYSPIRDLELMKKLNVPIRIILCGVENRPGSCWKLLQSRINEEYLNLAHATGGSIHLIKQDVYNLAQIKEGESITLNRQQFDFINGRFILKEKL